MSKHILHPDKDVFSPNSSIRYNHQSPLSGDSDKVFGYTRMTEDIDILFNQRKLNRFSMIFS